MTPHRSAETREALARAIFQAWIDDQLLPEDEPTDGVHWEKALIAAHTALGFDGLGAGETIEP